MSPKPGALPASLILDCHLFLLDHLVVWVSMDVLDGIGGFYPLNS